MSVFQSSKKCTVKVWFNHSGMPGCRGATRGDERWLADLHEEVHPSPLVGHSDSAVETARETWQDRVSFHSSLRWRKSMEIAEHGEVLVQSNCSLLSSNTSSVDIFIDLCFDVWGIQWQLYRCKRLKEVLCVFVVFLLGCFFSISRVYHITLWISQLAEESRLVARFHRSSKPAAPIPPSELKISFSQIGGHDWTPFGWTPIGFLLQTVSQDVIHLHEPPKTWPAKTQLPSMKQRRTYLEKPRTAVGWRGLISDPTLTGSEDMARGLALGRRVLLDILAAGLPTAVEFLDPLVAILGKKVGI